MNGVMLRIPITDVHPHPGNPRKNLGDLTELIESVKSKGILQPLTVIPYIDGGPNTAEYTVIMGHRRLAAAQLAGLREVPCVFITENVNSREQLEIMLSENMQRNDLTKCEEAESFQQLLDFGSDIGDIAEATGVSQSKVRGRLKLAKLDLKALEEKEKELIANGKQLSLDEALELNKLEDAAEQKRLMAYLGTRDFFWSVNNALRRQEERKKKTAIEKWLAEHDIKCSNQAPPGYLLELVNTLNSSEWDDMAAKELLKEEVKAYSCSDWDYYFYKYVAKKDARAKDEENAKQLAELNRQLQEDWKNFARVRTMAYNQRKEFIENFTVTNKNLEAVLMGAVMASVLSNINYWSSCHAELLTHFGISSEHEFAKEGQKRKEELCRDFTWAAKENLAKLIYLLFGDSEREGYSLSYTGAKPKYEENSKLNAIYHWLKLLGYKLATEEEQMAKGTHPLFQEKLL